MTGPAATGEDQADAQRDGAARMIDPEAIKTYTQLGSFGLVVFLVMWTVFKGIPAIRADAARQTEVHAATVESLTADYKSTLTKQAEKHEQAVQAVTDRSLQESRELRGFFGEYLDRLTDAIAGLASRVDGCPHRVADAVIHLPPAPSPRGRKSPDGGSGPHKAYRPPDDGGK